jgi:hypothetical protein
MALPTTACTSGPRKIEGIKGIVSDIKFFSPAGTGMIKRDPSSLTDHQNDYKQGAESVII